ncbi:MAG TPA: type II toxin-antitoxin system RatA family toxin [Burkholderiales bacterium]|jgi:ribosome-associated toxin RatA of RatAB toxin-antitoxin module|nr:type II toxin-antitoxin system RatA family toxin [Burkholderiales bacterium]
MALVEKSVLVHHTPEQMFNLVDAVEDYPKFLPWCGGAEVLSRDQYTTRARLHIDYHHIKQDFTTENIKEFPASMKITLVEGPFRNLDGVWRFIALGQEACKIEFRLHYEFSRRLLDTLFGPVFNYIASTFVDAFVKRAEKTYAKR